jgi:hypothetical protein
MFHPALLYQLTKERQAEIARMAQQASQERALKEARRAADQKQ